MSEVLFIRPKNYSRFSNNQPPLELLSVAGYVIKNGHKARILDLSLRGTMLKESDLAGTEVVLLAFYTLNRVESFKIARKLKKMKPSLLVVAGTIFCEDSCASTLWRYTLEKHPEIDVCLIGEPEESFLEIIQGNDLNSISGIAFRCKDNIISTGQRIAAEDLDKYGFPAWNLVDFSMYQCFGSGVYNNVDLSKHIVIPVRFSRGCVGSCRYCALWWMWRSWRTRTGKHMAQELIFLYQNYNLINFEFRDDCFGVNKKELLEFCDTIISSKVKIYFSVSTRVDVLNDRMILEKMKQAGCYKIYFGIETGSQKILDEFKKGVSVNLMIETVSLAKDMGFSIHALLIVGSPSETPETINETIDFLNHINPDSTSAAGGIMLMPGTAYYSQALSSGYISDSFWDKDTDYKIYYSNVSPFEIFLYSKAIRNRKKMRSMQNEKNWFNYLEYFVVSFFHVIGMRRLTEVIAKLSKKIKIDI